MRKPGKLKKVKKMDYLFVMLLLIGAFLTQIIVAWSSKNPFNLTNYLTIIPFIIVSNAFIQSGYHYGTENTSFLYTNIIWMAGILISTLAVNYFMFGNVPGAYTLSGLVLAAAALVLAGTGK